MFRHLDIDKKEREIGKQDPQCNTSKKNDSITKQDIKGLVAGSSVVLKSEFTTHTKENTKLGKKATRKQLPHKTRGHTIQSTLQNHHPSSPSFNQGDVATLMYVIFSMILLYRN